jgi:hypothetical protein
MRVCAWLELFWADGLCVIYRTLLISREGLERAKSLVASYKLGKVQVMSPELWQAKKVVDSTLHPGMVAIFQGKEERGADLCRYWRAGVSSL